MQKDILELLTNYLATFGFIYSRLTDDIKIVLKNTILTKDYGIKLGWFLYENIDEFYTYLTKECTQDFFPDFKEEELMILEKIEDSEDWLNKFHEFLILYYGKSGSFAKADSRFKIAIKPHLKKFRLDQMTTLLEYMNSNNQIYTNYNTIYFTPCIKKND